MNSLKNQNKIITGATITALAISFIGWCFYFSRGVDDSFTVEDINISGWIILISNIEFLILIAIPFIWRTKEVTRNLKIRLTLLCISPLLVAGTIAIFAESWQTVLGLGLICLVSDSFYCLIFHLSIVAAVWVNARFLIRRYLTKQLSLLFIPLMLLLALASAIINFGFFNYVIDKIAPSLYYISWFTVYELFAIMICYITFTTIAYIGWQYAKTVIQRNEVSQAELSALKAQINPHFLFNNLNTIYGMAERNDIRTKDVVLQLSDFLRYVLYDTSAEYINIEKEIEIIKTYIALQKERLNPEIVSIDFVIESEKELDKLQIAPLLLLPIIENCFKHGVGREPTLINISIKILGKTFHLKTSNKIYESDAIKLPKNGGIGLANVEKRLTLMYPDRHSFHYFNNDDRFIVELDVQLK